MNEYRAERRERRYEGSRMLELHGTLLMLRLHFFSIMRHAGMASA